MIDINGYSPVVDGTSLPMAYFGIRLAATPGREPLQDGLLPSDIALADYDNPQYNYFQMLGGVIPNDIMLDARLQWLGHPEARPGHSERRDCHRPRKD